MSPLLRIAIVLLTATIALSSPQQGAAALLSAFRGIDSRVDSVKVEQQVALTNGSDLLLAVGAGKPREGYVADPWIFALLVRERTGSRNVRVVGSIRQWDRGDCCIVKIVRAAADGVVLSQDGEKSPDEPHLKFFI